MATASAGLAAFEPLRQPMELIGDVTHIDGDLVTVNLGVPVTVNMDTLRRVNAYKPPACRPRRTSAPYTGSRENPPAKRSGLHLRKNRDGTLPVDSNRSFTMHWQSD
nr:hypothetical protein [Mesorhizobium amorphae]